MPIESLMTPKGHILMRPNEVAAMPNMKKYDARHVRYISRYLCYLRLPGTDGTARFFRPYMERIGLGVGAPSELAHRAANPLAMVEAWTAYHTVTRAMHEQADIQTPSGTALSVRAVAEILHTSRRTPYDWRDWGIVPTLKHEDKSCILPADLMAACRIITPGQEVSEKL